MINLPTDLLRSFVMVADLGSFTKAGDALGRSQPAVSLQIKRLEGLVRTTLFERRGRKFELTVEGAALAIYGRQILCLNDEAVSSLVNTEVTGSVRVGLPNDFAVSFLPEILAKFAKPNAGVALEVKCAVSVELLEDLQKDCFDLVIAMTGGAPRFAVAKVWTERLRWVTSRSGRAHKAEPLPLILYPQGCTYRNRIIDTLNRARKPWRIVYSSPSISGIHAAVQGGLGVTVLSEKTVPDDLRVLDNNDGFPGLADVQVGLYYNRNGLSKAALRLVNFIISCMDEAHEQTTPGARLTRTPGAAKLRRNLEHAGA